MEFGTKSAEYTDKTEEATFPASDPIEIVIDGLKANTQYFYRFLYKEKGAADYIEGSEYKFHTARAPGSGFVFTIQADAHNYRSDANQARVYDATLNNILADMPDFHVDLGDTFDMDTVKSAKEAEEVYFGERVFLGLVTHSSPFFFVIGNHENEEGWLRDGTADNRAIWSVNARKKYYPNPVPGPFYSGNSEVFEFVEGDGLAENYYAWVWGDALFVVIDPYWYTMVSPYDESKEKDNWRWTLGEEQYLWFTEVLESSKAKFKFVFAHHMVGGVTTYGRGGIEGAPFYEWGGQNEDGSWGFDEKRPGWKAPIHQIMVDNGVTVFFHGHDHIYVK